MNGFLKALAMIAPAAAERRWRLQMLLRGYGGATQGRRGASFRPSPSSANGALSRSLPVLRERSRDLVRNTFIGQRALSVLTTHIIGTDLSVRFNTGSKTADRQAQALWNEWCQSCDVEGETGFTGILSLSIRASLEGGDSILRFISTKGNDRPVPLALHAGEGDLIDHTRDVDGLLEKSSRARLGVELGDHDKRIGYWLHKTIPGESLTGIGHTSELVARRDICHIYRRIRPGQVRGVPVFAPVLMLARDYSDLMDALVVKERMQAAIGLIIKSSDTTSTIGAAMNRGDEDQPITSLRPGMIERLRPGEEAMAFEPSGNSSFDPVSRATLMGIAAGVGLTYHQLTGDLSRANYSSLRAGLLEFRREVADWQWHTVVPQALSRIVSRFIDVAILSKRLKPRLGGYPCEYVMPAFDPVDPKKDLEADILAVRAGRTSPQDFIEAWGRDWKAVIAEYTEFLAESDKAGLVFDIDARQRTRVGQEIATDNAAPAKTEVT